MNFWDYDFLLKVLFIICVTVCTVVFKNAWILTALTLIPLVET